MRKIWVFDTRYSCYDLTEWVFLFCLSDHNTRHYLLYFVVNLSVVNINLYPVNVLIVLTLEIRCNTFFSHASSLNLDKKHHRLKFGRRQNQPRNDLSGQRKQSPFLFIFLLFWFWVSLTTHNSWLTDIYFSNARCSWSCYSSHCFPVSILSQV